MDGVDGADGRRETACDEDGRHWALFATPFVVKQTELEVVVASPTKQREAGEFFEN